MPEHDFLNPYKNQNPGDIKIIDTVAVHAVITVVISNNVRLHLIGFNIHFMHTAAI